ncbi:hypothetical protein F8388_000433 [Cannabis sativa]|uniref:Pentatricopeptide repeat-containing protein n=1 Tax=Cannabis sativa TaxID=3483 RepID=A0A7J6EZI8_CANSA|nr:hypothetical protein F8388_000433 [Cannabis sativa]
MLIPISNLRALRENLGDFDCSYRRFSSVCCDSEIGDEVENFDDDNDDEKNEVLVVESSADPMEVDRVCKVIDELFELDRNMEAVLDEFFCWAGGKPGFAHDSRTYNSMMSILGKTRQFETLVSMLEEMGEKGLLTMETFMIAIKAFASAKERKKAVEEFDRGWEVVDEMIDLVVPKVMKAKGPVPNMKSYTILIRELCKQGKMREAVEYFDDLIESGNQPDTAVYTCLITGFGNLKNMDMVYELLKRDRERKVAHLMEDSTNALIKLMTSRKMPDEAVGVYKRMGKSGEACKYLKNVREGMKAPNSITTRSPADFSESGKPDILEEWLRK